MKKIVATLFLTALIAVNALGQSEAPTLKIVTESPDCLQNFSTAASK